MWIKILLVSSIVLYSCNKTKLPEIPDEPKLGSIEAVNIKKVSRVIGPSPKGETVPNPNNTMKRFGIGSTDYGNMWDAGNGKLWCIFGDNFDDRGGSWRSNAVAISSDKDLSDGLYYEDVLRDKDNKLMELIVSGAKTGKVPDEITCIPTAGVSVDNRQYINYMSVREWKLGGDNDSWLCNYSEIVYSDDYGKTWIRSGVKWDGLSKFVQVAYLRMDDTLYMYGTPAGRHSYVYLAKVAVDKVLNKSAYRYWDGVSWSSSEEAAAPIANGEVSEMTVQYNS